ncbi:tryptophan--tRNA ligase [Candidatus Hodarchaeum mangrovi]
MEYDHILSKISLINSFGGGVVDYNRLMNEFGITPFEEILDKIPAKDQHFYMARGIIFGHTAFESIIDAITHRKPFAVMTGIKPSSKEYHVGNLVTCRETIYLQKLGGKVFFCIADLESYIDGKVSLKQAEENAIENIADFIALGLDLDSAYVYRQSRQPEIMKLGYLLSTYTTYNMMKAIYGEHKMGIYNAAFIQVADILFPQVLYEPMPTIVPIGADQAPHARLSRDLARKKQIQDEYQFQLPSFIYHRLIEGLDGSEKMSKRNPLSTLTLFETQEGLHTKIFNVLTGGRISLKEQKKLGGNPHICRIFDLYRFFFENNNEKLTELAQKCLNGEIMCGEDKKNLISIIASFMDMHKQKRLDALPKAREIVLERHEY